MNHARILVFAAAALILVAEAPAQTVYSHTLPFGRENLDGHYQCYPIGAIFGGGPFNDLLGNCRWQWTYGWNELYHQCPVLITQLAFRRNIDGAVAGTTYPNVTIQLASLAPAVSSHTTMSGTLAANLGADLTVVYSGPVTIPPMAFTGAVPAPWNLVIPLQVPFSYDPTKLRDLVLDLTVSGASPVLGNYMLDGVFPHPGVSQNGHSTNGASLIRNAFNADAGAIVLVDYVLGNPVHMDLSVLTSGGGTGDLFYQITNLPPGASDGYTLISTTPSTIYGVPFGRGPLFGVYPDVTTFAIILSAPTPGSPFHWLLPAGGLFPDLPISAPPGTLTSFAGQTWECVAVALTPLGTVAGVSPPRQLAW